MNKKTKNLIVTGVIVALVVIGAVTAYHFYQESQKSGVKKAAHETVKWGDNAVDKTAKATKKAAHETVKWGDNAVDKTKKFFNK